MHKVPQLISGTRTCVAGATQMRGLGRRWQQGGGRGPASARHGGFYSAWSFSHLQRSMHWIALVFRAVNTRVAELTSPARFIAHCCVQQRAPSFGIQLPHRWFPSVTTSHSVRVSEWSFLCVLTFLVPNSVVLCPQPFVIGADPEAS